MRGIIIIASLLAFSVLLLVSHSFASEYVFGTKVTSLDSDAGKPLKNVRDGTVLGFWDIGSDPGSYDEGDVVYLDMPPTGIANANDIRLTPFSYHTAGSKVKSTDNDINSPLSFLPMEMRFLNLYGSRSYDSNDPVYVRQSGAVQLENIIYADNDATGSEGYASTTITTTAKKNDVESQGYSANSQGYAASSQGYVPSSQAYAPSPQEFQSLQGSISNINRISNDGFSDRLSYSGSCSNLPKGAICLTYSDNFKFVVSDYRIDCAPFVVGFCNSRPIEVIRCNSADYYHILGTQLVKIDPRQKTLFIQAASSQNPLTTQRIQSQNVPDEGNDRGVAQSADTLDTKGSNEVDIKDINKIVDAVNSISANSDSIRTYDIRLTPLGELAAGTKVIDFDLDQNKLVALPVLASFPREPDDYGAIRFYDANGNGLYDFLDDVYLDISFRGFSSFGTVSVNDVRISGPAI